MADAIKPLPAREFDLWKARHLLNRAGFGGTVAQACLLADWGLRRAVDHLVDLESVPAPADDEKRFDPNIMVPPTEAQRQAYRRAARMQDEETLARFRRAMQERQARDRRQLRDVQAWWLQRMIETPRPLEEKMTLFWHGHFASSYRKIENSYHLFLQNRLFRTHAVGNFGRLCLGIIRDPAMLAYLDNHQSRKGRPNENLARELMELFTLGEGDGYTERDVQEAARALTGYAFEHNAFIFRKDWHDDGRKTILGRTGAFDGDDLVALLLGQSVCSEFIAYKLYRFFVNDLPDGPTPASRAMIKAMAGVLRKKKYAIKPVLKTLFTSAHFYDESNLNARIKSPVELVVGTVRLLEIERPPIGFLLEALERLGQDLFQPPSVKGWDGGRSWINTSTLFVRQNLTTRLITGGRAGERDGEKGGERPFDVRAFLAGLPNARPGDEPERIVDDVLRVLFGTLPPEPRRRPFHEYVRSRGGTLDDETVIGVLLLATASPEYQLT